MLTCSKTYADIPFAHRQHRHSGHCAFIHGHNWSLTFTFACREPDENGFVVDFGGLKFIRLWIEKNLDHACLFNADDPMKEVLFEAAPTVWKAVVVPNCSCEGLAQWVFQSVDPLVREQTGDRVWLAAVEVGEDTRNAARYTP
jgi:6-pyruvoyltetrahydropterin/6-carboxytetrahydropterin synthase